MLRIASKFTPRNYSIQHKRCSLRNSQHIRDMPTILKMPDPEQSCEFDKKYPGIIEQYKETINHHLFTTTCIVALPVTVGGILFFETNTYAVIPVSIVALSVVMAKFSGNPDINFKRQKLEEIKHWCEQNKPVCRCIR